MKNYLKGEFYRIGKDKSNYFLFILPLIILLLGIFVNIKILPEDYVGTERTVNSLVLSFALAMTILVANPSFGREFKEGGLQRGFESGISPREIYLSKIIVTSIYGIISAAYAFLILFIVLALKMENIGGAFEIIKSSSLHLLLEMPILFSAIALIMALNCLIKKEVVTVFIWLFAISNLNFVAQLLSYLFKTDIFLELNKISFQKLIGAIPIGNEIFQNIKFLNFEINNILFIFTVSLVYFMIFHIIGFTKLKNKRLE